MRTLLCAAALVAAAAGCGADSSEERRAKAAALADAEATGREGAARCTGNPRRLFGARHATDVFVCIVELDGTRCDRYRVSRRGRVFAVTRVERNTDCSLPVG